jgi:prolipoprotein diacylglyceryltransferase
VIALIGWLTYRKYKAKLPSGRIFGLTIALIFLARFVIEFFKENQEAFEASMAINMGQILSIPFILTGVYFYVRSFREIPVEPSKPVKKRTK